MTTNMTAETPAAGISAESRNWAVAGHLSAFVTFFGVPSVLGPLVVWLLNQENPYVARQAKEALNFNLSFTIYGIVAGLAIIVLVGLIALPVVLVTWFVLVIVASIKAGNDEEYRYPFTIRFVV